jgi:hypothetical protein
VLKSRFILLIVLTTSGAYLTSALSLNVGLTFETELVRSRVFVDCNKSVLARLRLFVGCNNSVLLENLLFFYLIHNNKNKMKNNKFSSKTELLQPTNNRNRANTDLLQSTKTRDRTNSVSNVKPTLRDKAEVK